MLKYKHSILLLLLWWSQVSLHKRENDIPRPSFSVQVAFQSQSQLYTLQVYINNGRTLTNKRHITRDEFVRFATGHWPSIYNPKKTNFIELNGIRDCGIFKDSITGKDIIYCAPLDSLWKLRWSDFPFNYSQDIGWAGELRKPSLKQEKYLFDTYGVRSVDINFFTDTNFWKILRDVQDPAWIANYKAMR